LTTPGHALGSWSTRVCASPSGVAVPPSGEVRMVLRTTFKPRTENDMTTDKKVARCK
jgi:hypothetical protein